MSAGWIAGPLAAAEPRSLIKAAIGYVIALLATNATLSIVRAIADTITAGGFDVVALVFSIVGRAFYAVASTAYLLIPAIALGLLWSVVARAATLLRRPAEPR